MAPTSADLHVVLTSSPPGSKLLPGRRDVVFTTLRDFVTANEDPRVSPNYRDERLDEMEGLFKLMATPECVADEEVSLYALKVLKILSRKQENRLAFGRRGLNAVLRLLINPSSSRVAGEGSNVILNVCYEKENVDAILMCGGVEPLVRFLGERRDPDLQANAAGAIQSICFQEKGRNSVRDLDGVPAVLSLLAECRGNVKVQTRAIGAIHNMSSDADSIRLIRAKEGIPLVVDLLKSDQPAVCGSAAGALQNISREVASRRIIRTSGAVPLLGNLLVVGDVQAQVCAAGALLNILGPELSGEGDGGDKENEGNAPTAAEAPGGDGAGTDTERRALGRLISSALALSMVWDVCFDRPPDPKNLV